MASDRLGASAYCLGDRIGFHHEPDLRTAAHEAAHAVQQRSNFSLPDGVGVAHDQHERHADQVADAVVQGRSAERLLDRYDGHRTHSPRLQLQQRDPNAEAYQPQHPDFTPRHYPQPSGAGAAAQGRCDLPTGTLTWALAPRVGYVNARIEFVPNAAMASTNPTISYIQTVSSSLFNSDGQSEVDLVPSDKDPYYGARWDEQNQTWTDEPTMGQRLDPNIDDVDAPREGSYPYTPTTGRAVLNDSPHLNTGEVKYFETVITVIETGQVLGSLSWNIQRWEAGFVPGFLNRWLGWEQPTSTIVRNVVCRPGATPDFDAAMQRYAKEHPDHRRR